MKHLIIIFAALMINCSAFVDVDEPVIIFVGENNPVLEGRNAMTIYPDIFISSRCLNPDKCIIDLVIVHEMVHWKAQKNDPMWLIKYAIDKEFRFNEELIAYKKQIKYAYYNYEDEYPDIYELIDYTAHSLSSKYKACDYTACRSKLLTAL